MEKRLHRINVAFRVPNLKQPSNPRFRINMTNLVGLSSSSRYRVCIPISMLSLLGGLFALSFLFLNFSFAQEPKLGKAPKKPMRSIDELFLFFPTKYPEGDWAPKRLTFQDVYFSAADGTKLHGWYCPCDNPRAVILIAHGNGGHIANRTPWLEYLQSIAKVSVFIFDYRGYGRSEGKPSVKGVLEDARAARIQACKLALIADSQLVLMGESLGGAVVTQLASESPPRALILQSTFSSLKDVATVHYSKRLSWVIPKNKLNSAEVIKQYHGPLLQSHGSNDSIIPIELGKKLFDAANEPKTWYTVPGVDHNDALTPGYFEQLNKFLSSLP